MNLVLDEREDVAHFPGIVLPLQVLLDLEHPGLDEAALAMCLEAGRRLHCGEEDVRHLAPAAASAPGQSDGKWDTGLLVGDVDHCTLILEQD